MLMRDEGINALKADVIRATERRAAARRQRKCRALKKFGRTVLHIEVNKTQILQALRLARGYGNDLVLPRKVVEGDLAEVLELWSERWIRTRHS